jgi:hypothetical protein
LPDAAISPFLIAQLALPRAEEAFDLPVGKFLVVAGFDAGQVGRLAEGV